MINFYYAHYAPCSKILFNIPQKELISFFSYIIEHGINMYKISKLTLTNSSY